MSLTAFMAMTRWPRSLREFDQAMTSLRLPLQLPRWQHFIAEFLCFGIKEARACLFAGLFFLAVSLLVIMSFTLIANLKHIKARVQIN